jgi:hypothetical protein
MKKSQDKNHIKPPRYEDSTYQDRKYEDSRYQDYKHNKKYQRALSTQIALQEYDYMFTFQCYRENCQYYNENGTLTTSYVSFEELKSLVNEFFKRFNRKILGRQKAIESPHEWIQYLGVAENRSRHGDRVPLHCHVLVKSTPEFEKYIRQPTPLYLREGVDRVWGQLARKSIGVSTVLNIRCVRDDYGLAAYCVKHFWNEASQSMLFTHRDFIGRRRLYDQVQS